MPLTFDQAEKQLDNGIQDLLRARDNLKAIGHMEANMPSVTRKVLLQGISTSVTEAQRRIASIKFSEVVTDAELDAEIPQPIDGN